MPMHHLVVAALLVGSTRATFMEHDALAAKGFLNLAIHTDVHGSPSPGTCTFANVSIRREW
jgi:hypothetical protein